jgi:hypothetical protein
VLDHTEAICTTTYSHCYMQSSSPMASVLALHLNHPRCRRSGGDRPWPLPVFPSAFLLVDASRAAAPSSKIDRFLEDRSSGVHIYERCLKNIGYLRWTLFRSEGRDRSGWTLFRAKTGDQTDETKPMRRGEAQEDETTWRLGGCFAGPSQSAWAL